LNTELPKTDPNGIKTGYKQVDTLVFGKYNKLGVSLPLLSHLSLTDGTQSGYTAYTD